MGQDSALLLFAFIVPVLFGFVGALAVVCPQHPMRGRFPRRSRGR